MMHSGSKMSEKHIYTTLKTIRCGFLDHGFFKFLSTFNAIRLAIGRQKKKPNAMKNTKKKIIHHDNPPLLAKVTNDNFKVVLSDLNLDPIKPGEKTSGEKLTLKKK